ncbi:hypothetical protein JAAARDRAFT_690535, partial [Jaapia argillacea MUCL 33604]
LTSEEVWDGFVILALLEDQEARGGKLIVPHRGDQRLRFTEAIQARNNRMRLYGQPALTHFCDKCVRRYADGRKVSVVVTDGVTVGHPCCAVHNCHIPLANNRHRFCPNHANEEDRCSIIGCESNVTAGKRTCADPLHQDVERTHTERGQARFQLKQRLERARVAHPNDALPVEVNAGEMEDIDLAEEQYVELRAQFGRKRTHNEQLIVAPCGMIHARETFFGAEAVSSVAEMIRRTYYYPGLMPDHIFYDNNCTLRKHVQNDPVFQDVGLTVDVFHFKSKHSEKDLYCDTHCNPTDFPELLDDDGGFFFNSSIAEQTNVWFGGYHSICREMLVDKYNFFLDEMILRRNRMTHDKLSKEGRHPGYYHINAEA